MKNYIFIFCLAFICLAVSFHGSAQVSSYIYGIDNPSAGNYYFSKAEIASGIVTGLAQIPIPGLGGEYSSCVDADGLKYYFCTGVEMMAFDPVSGSMLWNQLLPLSPNTQLLQIQYNTCDSSIYGILNTTVPPGCHFARYNPSANLLTTISQLPQFGFAAIWFYIWLPGYAGS
jgi:hypothetical protein